MLSRPAGPNHTLKDYSSSETMREITMRASTIRAIGCILLFMGGTSFSISVLDSTTESMGASTPHSLTSVILDLRITNRVYKASLADQHSTEYSTLKHEVDQLFADIYALSYNRTHLMYLGTDEMIFSNGSVIATSRLLFGPTQVSPELVRGIFLPAYKQITAPALEIDLGYTDNELPTEGALEDEKNFHIPTMAKSQEASLTSTDSMSSASMTTYTPGLSDLITNTELLTSQMSSTQETPNMPTSSVIDLMNSTATSFFSNSTIQQPTTNSVTNYTTTLVAPDSTTNETTTKSPMDTSTLVPVGTNTTTASNGTTIILPTASTPKTQSGTSISSTTPTSTTTSTLGTTIRPNFGTEKPKTSSTTFPTAPPQKTTVLNYLPIKSADLVPGWAVALLALAGASVFLLIILIVLVVVWCCCPRRRVFVNEAEEMNPPMYYSPDIPMYSTQSTFETANNKQAV